MSTATQSAETKNAPQSIEVKKGRPEHVRDTVASFFDEVHKVREEIAKRAREIFDSNGIVGRDLENWLTAEREVLWEPSIEVSEKDNRFVTKVAVAGVDPKDLQVQVTPDELLIAAESKHEHTETKGEVHCCEFATGKLFRRVRFSKRVDPDKSTAQLKNGMLHVITPIAEGLLPKRLPVQGT